MLDEALADLPAALADLGLPVNLRIGPATKPSYAVISFTPNSAGLRPFAPVQVAQPWRQSHVPGDLLIRWMRRDRALSAYSWNTAEIPISEQAEHWQVEIMDGAAVKRVLTSTPPEG